MVSKVLPMPPCGVTIKHPLLCPPFPPEGVILPMSHHQTVHSNGSLSIASVTRAWDEGRYSCSARDKQGREDSQGLQLQVNGE